MKKYTVTFLPQNMVLEVEEGTTLLQAEQMAGLEPDAPCGGKGTCGKCKVNITEGERQGIVLACQTPVDCDMKVDTLYQEKVQRILTDGLSRQVPVEPGVGWTEGDAGRPFYLMAFDIGTTTIVGYLLDGKTGKEVSLASTMNPQHQFGADVIARSNYVLEHGGEEMKQVVRKALNQLIGQACQEAGGAKGRDPAGCYCGKYLYASSVSGHLTQISGAGALCAGGKGRNDSGGGEECGLRIAKGGKLLLLPNIAGFVGGDTVGCMLSVAFDRLEDMTLMIDIGTNGELVMGNRHKMVTTSTAAGPAFEGAKIECGMRGARGAISHITVQDGKLALEVIEGVKPVGICGSGLIDGIAFMIRYGILDSYGSLCDPEDLTGEFEKTLAWRLKERDGKPVFVLVPGEGDRQRGGYLYQSEGYPGSAAGQRGHRRGHPYYGGEAFHSAGGHSSGIPGGSFRKLYGRGKCLRDRSDSLRAERQDHAHRKRGRGRLQAGSGEPGRVRVCLQIG